MSRNLGIAAVLIIFLASSFITFSASAPSTIKSTRARVRDSLMKAEDKFGNVIYPSKFLVLLRNGDVLSSFGYSESQTKRARSIISDRVSSYLPENKL